MQLFSRKKALLAASLSALSVLGACGDDVTVAPITTNVTVAISPPSQTLNIGESANFSVQITGGSTSAPATLTSCTSSNTAVATATVQSGSCRVTAVSAGNATVTATSGTASASASVTVAAASAAISNLQLSPSTANVAVGQSITVVPNVTKAATAVTTTFAYATSNAAVATVNATTGVITAVAPGIATITVTATGTGTGYTTTSLSGGVTVNVSAAPAGVTSLSVQPTSATLAVGGTLPLAASASQPSGAPQAQITYGTNAPATATVSAAGVITAVAPGSAVITVTATSAAGNGFGASTASVLVPVTVTPQAQVIINSLTDQGQTIDITNVAGQFEVNLQLQPNGQNVSSVQAYVCDQGESQAACIARGPSAQQTFGAAGGQAGPIQLYINSAEFTAPNFVTGADANTLYKNGLKTIVATVTTTTPSAAPNASNNLSAVAFNNQDGWTIQWTQPANRAQDANSITWYGGPSTPDALLPGSQSGTGSFVVVPVLYTPNRTITQANLGFVDNSGGFVCGNGITDNTRPFGATYGTDARSTAQASINFNCATNLTVGTLGAVSDVNGYVPTVTGSVDNNNANGPTTAGITPVAATSIYTPISANALGNPTFAGRYRQSLSFRPTTIFIPGDYRSPTVISYDVRGGTNANLAAAGVYVDSAWVNNPYSLAGGFSAATGNPVRLNVSDNLVITAINPGPPPTATTAASNGVGLLGTGATTSARNTQFRVCAFPTTISATAATNCTSPLATGGITSTIQSIGLGESATDFTNGAYLVQVVETDRLGNRAQSNPFGWANANAGTAQAQTIGTSTNALAPQAFGVDVTAPTVVAIPNSGAGATPNFARTDADSIYATAASGLNGAGNITADAAVFGVRFTDTRSGFFQCVAGVNCNAAAVGTQVRGGAFQIVRRSLPASPSLANDAVVENLVTATSAANLARNGSINAAAGTNSGDPSIREFYVNIGGDNARNTATTPTPNVSFNQAGYYTFNGTLVDRAGNSTAFGPRSVAIDNATPSASGITVPALLTGGQSVSFPVTGADDLEDISADLALTYPQLGRVDFGSAQSQSQVVRFRRVPFFSATPVLGFFHNPFAAITDNKLTSPVGPGIVGDGGKAVPVPVPFISNIVSAIAGGGIPTQAQVFSAFTANEAKPTAVSAWLFDIRATSSKPFTDGGMSAAQTQNIAGGQITGPTIVTAAKDWSNAVGGVGITNWAVFNPTAGGTIEFRATTSTSVTNPPFTAVHVIRLNGATWEFLGTATYAGPLDQGALRFWRYTFTSTSVDQGQFIQAALANGQAFRGIGVDAAGNGLATANTTFGFPNALGAGEVITNSAIVSPITNASAAQAITLTLAPNANAATLTWACTSSNPTLVSATMTGVNTCTIAPNSVYAGAATPVTITFTATGSQTNFSTNTIVQNPPVVVSRTP